MKENSRRVRELFEGIKISKIHTNAMIGRQQFIMGNSGELTKSEAIINIKTENYPTLDSLIIALSKVLDIKFPDAVCNFTPVKNIFELLFPTRVPPVILKIHAKNRQSTLELTDYNKISELLKPGHSSGNIEVSQNVELSVDLPKLFIYNIKYESLIHELRTVFGKINLGKLSSGGNTVSVYLTNSKSDFRKLFTEVKVTSNNGSEIPLNALLSVAGISDLSSIISDEEGEYLSFIPDGIPSNIDNYHKRLTSLFIYTDYDISLAGSLLSSKKLLKRLELILIVSVLLLYFILAAQFESLTQPLIILSEVLLDIAGALGFLMLFGSSLNIMSAIGIIVMSGIIINDSILKIDTINSFIRKGATLSEAILEGGRKRLKPIIITSLTTILTLVPLLFFQGLGVELQRPFAVAIIGGMTVGTIISLFFIPLAYRVIYRNGRTTGLSEMSVTCQ